ncbi:ferredoxin [Candidatus Woesearchaeota archaeon]|nr:ferredoxin [Candidatus Woesearchaeota archaeon]
MDKTSSQSQKHPIPGRKYRVVYDKAGCIGVGACEAAAPLFWKLQEDGKATFVPKEAKKSETAEELIIDGKDFKVNLEAAEVCPVQVIKIFDEETGEQIFP